MIITFQIQVEPDKELTKSDLEQMLGTMFEFCAVTEKVGYTRAQMFVDGEAYVR